MRAVLGIGLAAVSALLSGCDSPKHSEPPAPAKQATESSSTEDAKITQLYATESKVAKGENTLLCYGVENASAVWLDPGHKELSAALSRCIEVTPGADTTYVLSAQSPGGKTVTRELKIAAGAARVRIQNVNVSAVEVKAGDLVSICYTVSNATHVTIDPLKHRAGADPKGCATDQPRKTTTYTITAIGPAGDADKQSVTVRVK